MTYRKSTLVIPILSMRALITVIFNIHIHGDFSRRRFRNDGSNDSVDSDSEQHDDENRRRKRDAETLKKVGLQTWLLELQDSLPAAFKSFFEAIYE